MERPEFEAVLGSTLDAVDHRNRTGNDAQAGRPIRWRARDLEAVLLYRRYARFSTVKRALAHLSNSEDCVALLGTAEPPSASTVSRYLRTHFEAVERAALLKALDQALVQSVCALPGFDDEARVLGMDGSKIETHYMPPWEGIPEHRVTAPEAGWVGKSGGPKSGRGFQMVALWTERGTPLAWDISALSTSEYGAAERVLERYGTEILPHRNTGKPSVLTADGGFSSATIRSRCQSLGVVPNIHRASHGDADRSVANAKRLATLRYQLNDGSRPHTANWHMNGHGELGCRCGHGRTERVVTTRANKLTIATVGRCENCGTVTVTCGCWRPAQNPRRLVRASRREDADPFWGNPLTFHDPLARAYGEDRFGWNESLHSTLNSRFGLLKTRCWLRRLAQVEAEFASAFIGIHALLLERARRAGLATASPPV